MGRPGNEYTQGMPCPSVKGFDGVWCAKPEIDIWTYRTIQRRKSS
jgi:hypothetical protein